jgi:hypothetical protein
MLLQPRLLVECRAGTNGCRAERPLFGGGVIPFLLDHDNYYSTERDVKKVHVQGKERGRYPMPALQSIGSG